MDAECAILDLVVKHIWPEQVAGSPVLGMKEKYGGVLPTRSK